MKPFDPALLRDLPGTRRPVTLLAAVGVASGVVAIATAVLLAVTVSQVVTGGSAGVGAGTIDQLLPWLVALASLVVARGLLAALGEYVARMAGLRVAGLVRLAALRRWLGRPVEQRPGDETAVSRASEGVAAIEPYVGRYLPALVTGVVVPALAVLTLLWVDPWSALIVLLTLPLLPVFAALIGQHTADETQRRWAAMDLLAGHFLDVVKGLPTLVGYGRARAQVDVVAQVGQRHRRATVTTLRTAFLSTAALELLATISVALVAVAVGLRLAYGAMDLQVGLMAILLAPEAYWPIRRVGAEFHSAADGSQVLEQLSEEGRATAPATATPGAHPEDQRPGQDAVGLVDVSYAYPGRQQTLVGTELLTPATPGLTALTGPSGAGKTTVLELLAGLRLPAAGTVLAPATHLASQRPVILPGTVRDNLALLTAGTSGDDRLHQALERVGLWKALAEREGLDTELGDDGFGLSAGQLARAALARAVLSDAPLVLLDEPTANVSAAGVPRLHEVITDLAATRRVIVVTHDPYLVALADQRWELEPAPAAGPGRLEAHVLQPTGSGAPGAEARIESRSPSHTHTHTETPYLGSPLHAPSDVGSDSHTPTEAEPQIQTRSAPTPGLVRPIRTPDGRRGLALACVLGGLALGAGVALTATSGWLIVQASTQPVILTLLVAIVGVRAFGLARPVFRYAERVVSHDVALADLATRRADVFARLIRLTPARLGRRSRGQLLTALVRDLDDVVDAQVRVTVPAWSVVIASLIGAGIAAVQLPAAGLAVLLGSLAVLAIGALAARVELSAQQQAVGHRGELQHRTTALVGRLLQVQAVTGLHSDPTPLLDPIATAQDAQERAERRLITTRALALAAVWSTLAATSAVVLVLAWQAHAAGQLSAPYAALVALLPMALADVWGGIPDIAGARARAMAADARLAAVLDQEPAVATTGTLPVPQEPTPAALHQVTAAWHPTGPEALAALDLELRSGARLQLTGPNGSGKSTALAVLARHLDPRTGTYTLAGADTASLDTEQVRARIAMVDDEPHAFAGSVRANLTLACPQAADEELIAALLAVDLGRWLATLPQGLDTPVSGLSGGERARLSLARALLSTRPVVLLDEPTAHLDDATAERALGGMLGSRVADQTAFVLVSHRPVAVDGWPLVSLERPDQPRSTTSNSNSSAPVATGA